MHELQRELPALTRGECVFESAFERYRAVRGRPVPSRPRSLPDPLDRKEYVLQIVPPRRGLRRREKYGWPH